MRATVGFLSDITADVRRRLDRRPLDEAGLLALALEMPLPRGFSAALRDAHAPAVIAEVKRSSPSSGRISEVDPGAQARAYESGGAAAVSVLTEPTRFDGSLADLRAVRLASRIPVLRKDFLVHPVQVIEARAAGADAVLLIAAALSQAELAAMLGTATDLGLDALVETHTEGDLEKALAVDAPVVGVNARDLETLEVDRHRALRVLAQVPPERVAVLESGISTRDEVEAARRAGAGAVLVGEVLMRAADPAAAIRGLRGAA